MISTVHRSFKKNTAHRHLELTDEQYTKIFGNGICSMLYQQGWRMNAEQLLKVLPVDEYSQIYSELLQGHIQYVKVHRPLGNKQFIWGRGSGKSLVTGLFDDEREQFKPENYKQEYLGTWVEDKKGETK